MKFESKEWTQQQQIELLVCELKGCQWAIKEFATHKSTCSKLTGKVFLCDCGYEEMLVDVFVG